MDGSGDVYRIGLSDDTLGSFKTVSEETINWDATALHNFKIYAKIYTSDQGTKIKKVRKVKV
jgi:hypothetical protein